MATINYPLLDRIHACREASPEFKQTYDSYSIECMTYAQIAEWCEGLAVLAQLADFPDVEEHMMKWAKHWHKLDRGER